MEPEKKSAKPSIKEHIATFRMLLSIFLVVTISLMAWAVRHANSPPDYYWVAMLSLLLLVGLDIFLAWAYNQYTRKLDGGQ